MVLLAAPIPSVHAKKDIRRSPVVIAVERTSPAVVNVYTETVVETPFVQRRPYTGDPFFDDLFSEFFGGFSTQPRRQKRTSLGSGFLVDKTGTVLTNEHVILRASSIRVLMSGNQEFTARLIGADSDSDLAVLKIDAEEPFPYIPIPEDDSIMIGETVIAIGNPYGLSHTVTTGVVSARDRTIRAGDLVYHDLLQTDASINPGNSGGPLVDVEGRLVGINTAIHREAEGIGFAIPTHKIRSVVGQILHYGAVQPSWLGLMVQNLTPEIAFHFGVEAGSGVLVRGLENGSPAATSGLRTGAIIVRIDGHVVSNLADYRSRVDGLTAGEQLHLVALQDGKTIEVTLEVAVYPAEKIDRLAWMGMGVKVSSKGAKRAIVVTDVRPRGPAASIGIRPGDIIAGLGGHELEDLDSFRRRLASLRNSNSIMVSVIRGRVLYRVTLPLEKHL